MKLSPNDDEASVIRDARRYRRLEILGCAVMDTPELEAGNVSRFSNLAKIVDDDLRVRPSRGECCPLEAANDLG